MEKKEKEIGLRGCHHLKKDVWYDMMRKKEERKWI